MKSLIRIRQAHGVRSVRWTWLSMVTSLSVVTSLSMVTGLLLLSALISPIVRAETPAPPKAETILEKAIEAEGGRAVMEKVQSRYSKGWVEMPKMGIKLTYTSYAMRPNLNLTVMESPAIGKLASGVNGEIVWENSAMQGPSIKESDERAVQLREADFDGLAGWKRWFNSADCVGADSVEGKPTWKVIMTPKEGAPETWFFDQDSGLLVKTMMTLKTGMGEVPIESYAGDYRRVDGLMLAFKNRQVLMGGLQEMVYGVDSVAHNVKIPKERFDLPAEIKALLEKQKADTTQVKETK